MFEHMAFKGTDKIGTKNYVAEQVALAKVEKAYAAYQKENLKEVGRTKKKSPNWNKLEGRDSPSRRICCPQ